MKDPRGFNVLLANELARLETYNKHLYRPNTYLHKWWARRCGSTFRLILKHLSKDEGSRDYYQPGGLEQIIVLDPMMGGGTTLHEAMRMGANVIGFDIDPIPVLQAKASLSTVESSLLEDAFDFFFERLRACIEPYFTATCSSCGRNSTTQFMLYGQKRRCSCRDVVVVDSLLLRQESNGDVISLCGCCGAVRTPGNSCECGEGDSGRSLITKDQLTCQSCLEPFQERLDLKFFERYEPIAVRYECPDHGLRFGSITRQHLERLEKASTVRSASSADDALIITEGPKSKTLIQRAVASYDELFSSRQIAYLHEAIKLLGEMEYPARLFLSLLASTSLEFNSMLCGYKGVSARRAGAIRHVFSHHAYSVPYTALEANPVFHRPTSGTVLKLFSDRIRKARKWSGQPRERVLGVEKAEFQDIRGERDQGVEVLDAQELLAGTRRYFVRQGSAESLPLGDESVDLIVTDPPYFDSVEYEDLSAFFRPWLQKMLTGADGIDVDWHYREVVRGQAAVRPYGEDTEAQSYGNLMSRIFLECRRVLRREDGRLVFTFHHWDHQAWSALTLSLYRAGFRLMEFYVVHSENPSSVHIANMRALTDDAILFFSPAEGNPQKLWDRPGSIEVETSAGFTRDCANTLGWILQSSLDEGQISELWKSQFKFLTEPAESPDVQRNDRR